MTLRDTRSSDIFFDFLCPYAWRGLEMAAALREGGEVFRLRHFSLVEGNHPDNAGTLNWRLTDQPLQAQRGAGYVPHQTSSLNAFLVALAAAQQGEDAAWKFTLALDRLHHEKKQPLVEDTFIGAATQAGLDLPRLAAARQDEVGLRRSLRAELDAARATGVFGTPTFVLPEGDAAYYRFEHLTRDHAQAKARWELFKEVLRSDAEIGTIKRAKPQ